MSGTAGRVAGKVSQAASAAGKAVGSAVPETKGVLKKGAKKDPELYVRSLAIISSLLGSALTHF
jgi:hypothetical protein